MCASLGQIGRFEEKEKFLPLPGFESHNVQSSAVLSKYSMNPFTLAIISNIYVFNNYFTFWKNLGYNHETPFLGAFATFRKANMSFVMSVRLSIRMEQLGSHWTDFHEI